MPTSMPLNQAFVSAQFWLEPNVQTYTSPLTYNTKRRELDGARWRASYTLPHMERHKAAEWKAFFTALRGQVNTFYAYDPDNKTPRGAAGGTPLVNGANQTGTSLIIDGCTPNQYFLLAGDYFNVGSALHMITQPILADGSGNATLVFEPYLRTSPADNAPITTSNCTCTMILADNLQAGFEINANGIYLPKTFTAYEVF